MKKAIVLSVIGLVAGLGATTALGQGQTLFNTYSDSIPVTGDVSSGTASSFTMTLMYSLSSVSQSAGNDLPVAGLLQAYQMPDAATAANGMITATGFWYGTGGSTTGLYFIGGANSADFQLASYTTGATVWMEALAYNGSSYASSTIRGHSAVWSQTLAVAPTAPTAMQMSTFAVSTVVPEPTTMALGGLGMAALMLFRRKKV